MAAFTPRHAQPFTLEQAMLLEVDMLLAEISRLTNSITHLQSTQTELRTFIHDDPDNDADGELGKAVAENEDVIASQTERIELIKVALRNKVGEGAMRHMGLLGGEAKGPGSVEGAAAGGPPRRESDHSVTADADAPRADDGDGLHL